MPPPATSWPASSASPAATVDRAITRALHDALDRELSKEAVVYKGARAQEYVFFQVADFLCAMELVAVKFAAHEVTATDEKFFGASLSKFKKLYLRQVRSKEL